MSLIDIDSANSELSNESVTTPFAATLTPTTVPQKLFEYPLRETSSFPHILNTMEKENDRKQILNDELIYKINAVQFNAGCSSSSTDLDKLIEFYNEHSDEETLAQWMNIYEEQKLANSIAAAAKESSNLGRFKNRDISDSVDDLLHQSPKRVSKAIDALNKDAPINRSMDLGMNINDREGFFALEKCQSADFQVKYDLPRSRLLRSKEMPNIADVDDDTEY